MLDHYSDQIWVRVGWLSLASVFLFFSAILVGIVPIKRVMLLYYKELDIDLAFIVSLTFMVVFTFPLGVMNDRLGPKKTALIGSLTQAFGHGFLAVCFRYSIVPLLVAGFALDGLANPIVMISILHFANTFPTYSMLVTSFLTGIWDLSAILGYVIYILHKTEGFTLTDTFMFSSGVYVVMFGLILLFFPSYVLTPNKVDILGEEEESERDERKPLIEKEKKPSKVIISLLILSSSLFILQTNFYLTNVQNILENFVSSTRKADSASMIFSLMFPLVGFLASVVTGITLQRFGCFAVELFVTICQLVFVILSCIPWFPIQYGTFVVYVVFRMSMYASLNSILFKLFPTAKIGTYFGIVYGVAGVINLLGFLLTFLSLKVFHGNFLIAQIFLGGCSTLTGFSFAISLFGK